MTSSEFKFPNNQKLPKDALRARKRFDQHPTASTVLRGWILLEGSGKRRKKHSNAPNVLRSRVHCYAATDRNLNPYHVREYAMHPSILKRLPRIHEGLKKRTLIQ